MRLVLILGFVSVNFLLELLVRENLLASADFSVYVYVDVISFSIPCHFFTYATIKKKRFENEKCGKGK